MNIVVKESKVITSAEGDTFYRVSLLLDGIPESIVIRSFVGELGFSQWEGAEIINFLDPSGKTYEIIRELYKK